MSMYTDFVNQFPNFSYPTSGFSLFHFSEDIYLGISSNQEVVLAIQSSDPQRDPRTIYTDSLNLSLNAKATLTEESISTSKTMNILAFKPGDNKALRVFFEICGIFINGPDVGSTDRMVEIFETIRSMFSRSHNFSFSELQGLYTELFLIRAFESEINLAKYWHSEENQKFDFSISSDLKIEVKSTLGDLRKHHFQHDQLSNNLNNIYVSSFMLQRDDQGLSLEDLVHSLRDLLQVNEKQYIRVQKILLNTDSGLLSTVRFNEQYTVDRLRFYKGVNIPRFAESTPTGVTSAEYDSILETAPTETLEDILHVVQVEDSVNRNVRSNLAIS